MAKDSSSVTVIFAERMEYEGNEAAFAARAKDLMASTGKRWGQVRWEAMKDFGYVNPKTERAMAAKRAADKDAADKSLQVIQVAEVARAESKRAATADEFTRAMEGLPDVANPSQEIEWIRSHPAMSRKARGGAIDGFVMITADDILHAGSTRAPSKSAVNQLIHWSNDTARFYTQLLGEDKKRMDTEDEETKAGVDVSLGEVRAYLQTVKSALEVTSETSTGWSEGGE